jgi:hypothetical protein
VKPESVSLPSTGVVGVAQVFGGVQACTILGNQSATLSGLAPAGAAFERCATRKQAPESVLDAEMGFGGEVDKVVWDDTTSNRHVTTTDHPARSPLG